MKKKIRYLIFIISAIVIILFLTFDTRLKTVTYNIKSPEITGEVNLALVTDLHSCYYGENQNKLLNRIEKYCPDAVLLGGDIFDDILDDAGAKIFIKRVAEKYKTYYVSGNHEWWSNKMYDFFDFLNENNVIVLRGNTDVLKTEKDTVIISGIDDPDVNVYDSVYTGWDEQLSQVGEAADDKYLNILLAHRPENALQYFKYDFDVVLSGHTHGGQIRIPFILNGLFAPNQGFLPELAGGEYDFDGKKLIVSRGLSLKNQKVPRVFNRPELVFVTLSPEQPATNYIWIKR